MVFRLERPLAILAATLAACGGGIVPIGNESPGDGGLHGSGDSGLHLGGPDGSMFSDGNPRPALETGAPDGAPPGCPTEEPMAGSTCTEIGEECEYGTNTATACNSLATCKASGWSIRMATTPASSATCEPSKCPPSYPAGPVDPCPKLNGLDCSYPGNGTCNCSPPTVATPDGGDGAVWQCVAETAGCPVPRPAIGSMCSTPGITCDYGKCTGGVELKCKGGAWTKVVVGCPS